MSEYSGIIGGMQSDSSSSTQRNAPNFSRPHPKHSAMKSASTSKSNAPRHVHIIDAFHDPTRNMPLESRISEESERAELTSSENSTGSESAWDGRSGELDQSSRKKSYNDQRSAGRDHRLVARPTTPRSSSNASSSASSRRTFEVGLPSDSEYRSNVSRPLPHIVKRISVDQRSERISISTDQCEDTASHHTASESGDSGSVDGEGRWQSSDYDTSSLSAAEIRKLEKKGINPALYMEMQEAKKGKKKWMPSLLGNGFVN